MSFFPAFNKGIFFLGTSNALKPLKAIFFHGCWPSSGNFPNCQALKEFCQEKMGIPTFVSACSSEDLRLVPSSMDGGNGHGSRLTQQVGHGRQLSFSLHGQKVKHYSSNPPSITPKTTRLYKGPNITRLPFSN